MQMSAISAGQSHSGQYQGSVDANGTVSVCNYTLFKLYSHEPEANHMRPETYESPKRPKGNATEVDGPYPDL